MTTGGALIPTPRRAPQFLHHFDEDTCVALLRRLRGALRPGGLVAINDFLRGADTYGPWAADPQPVQFGYLMLISTERGRSFTRAEVRRILARAGMQQVAEGGCFPLPNSLVLAAAA